MRLLLATDVDEKDLVDYCLVDLCDRKYKKRLKERITLYLKSYAKNEDLIGLSFNDLKNPVYFYAGSQKLSKSTFILSPLVHQKAKTFDGVPELTSVYEIVDCSGGITPSFEMAEIECLIGDEGLFYQAYHANGGQMIVTAPVQIELLAKKLGVKLP